MHFWDDFVAWRVGFGSLWGAGGPTGSLESHSWHPRLQKNGKCVSNGLPKGPFGDPWRAFWATSGLIGAVSGPKKRPRTPPRAMLRISPNHVFSSGLCLFLRVGGVHGRPPGALGGLWSADDCRYSFPPAIKKFHSAPRVSKFLIIELIN